MKIPTSIQLETDRCRLRFISKQDIPHIFSATRFSGFNDGMLWEPPETEEELLEPFERNVKAWSEGVGYTFTIESKETDGFIGRITTRRQSDENVWDLGFWTHPEHQSLGYMTESTERIIEFCFNELYASKVVACHATWNKSSEKVLKKNGLTFTRNNPEGFKKRGAWVEENELEITRENWNQNKPNQALRTTSASARRLS